MPPRTQSLLTASVVEPDGLDPQLEPSLARQRLTPLFYNCLLQLAPDLTIQPDLAESWNVSPDGKTLEFRLRPGIRWHDGRELEADDVKFSYERLIEQESPAKLDFEAIETIEVPDKLQVVFRLRQPHAGLLASMADARWGAIVSRAAIEKYGELGLLREHAVGTGPFVLEEWVPGREMRLRRHPDYFARGLPRLERLTIRFLPDEATVAAALRAGKVDHALLEDPQVLGSRQGERDLVVHRTPRLAYYFLLINHARSPYNDRKVVQALSAAVDRADLARNAGNGYGSPTAPAPAPMALWQLDRHQWEPFYAVDLDRARQLLAEVGLPDGFRTRLTVAAGFPVLAACAQTIQANLLRIGVEVDVESADYADWVKRWIAKEYDLTVSFTGGAPDPDGAFYWPFHSEGANWNNWHEPEVDRLLEQGRTTYDYGQRKGIYDRVQLLLLERVPQLWLFCPEVVDVTQPWVLNWTQHPTTLLYGLDRVAIQPSTS